MSVFLGNGTFQAGGSYLTGGEAMLVAAGDLDGDGRPDLVVANHRRSSLSVPPAATQARDIRARALLKAKPTRPSRSTRISPPSPPKRVS